MLLISRRSFRSGWSFGASSLGCSSGWSPGASSPGSPVHHFLIRAVRFGKVPIALTTLWRRVCNVAAAATTSGLLTNPAKPKEKRTDRAIDAAGGARRDCGSVLRAGRGAGSPQSQNWRECSRGLLLRRDSDSAPACCPGPIVGAASALLGAARTAGAPAVCWRSARGHARFVPTAERQPVVRARRLRMGSTGRGGFAVTGRSLVCRVRAAVGPVGWLSRRAR